MKSFLHIIALSTVAVMAATAQETAVPPALLNFPTDGLRVTGETVTVQLTPEFTRMQQELAARVQQLPTERKLEFLKNYSSTTLLSYADDLWSSKAAYDSYCAEWKKITLIPQQTVQIGAYSRGAQEWGLHGVAINTLTKKVTPLSISGLTYKADSNVWVSPNGELSASPVSTTSDNVYGARKGTAWILNKEDSLSRLREVLTITKRTNGEFVYLTYEFSERAPGTGAVLAQGSYVLRFRVGPPAPDPETAKAPVQEVKEDTPKQEVKKEQPQQKKKSKSRRKRRR